MEMDSCFAEVPVLLYDYVPQGIIHVDSQVISCQGTQVRLGSQMVEESLVLTQYCFELTEEEFIIKEDGEMEASVSRISLAASCQLKQGSCVSSESVFLWENSLQYPFFRHASWSRLELGDCLQAGCLQGVSEEFEHGGEGYSLNTLLRGAEDVLVNAVNPFWAMFLKYEILEFYRILLYAGFVGLYGVSDRNLVRKIYEPRAVEPMIRKISYLYHVSSAPIIKGM